MDDCPDIFRFSVLRCGGVARRNLEDGHEGGIAAVFRSSFYLEAGGDFACVGSETVEPSPLNVISDAPGDTDWSASGLRVGAQWRVCAETVYVGGRFSFDLDDAEDWKPQAVPADWRAADLRRGLEELRHRATGRVPRDGLGFLILSGASKPGGQTIGKTAETHAVGLRQWLADTVRGRHAAASDGSRWIHPLIGLGPGLTPAGDDFIGGIMIAMHSLGQEDNLRRLWAAARPSAIEAGNPISLAHLSAASEGMGSAAVHRTLTATLTGRPEGIDRHLDAIDRIGHTSGWDTLAGVVLALDAWIAAHDRGRLGRVARSTRQSQGGVRT